MSSRKIQICVFAILVAILSATGCKSDKKRFGESKENVGTCLDAVQEFMADPDSGHEGDCPKGLDAVVKEGRLKDEHTKDGWGNAIKIKCRGETICAYSFGPNEKDDKGGGDDIKACTGN